MKVGVNEIKNIKTIENKQNQTLVVWKKPKMLINLYQDF